MTASETPSSLPFTARRWLLRLLSCLLTLLLVNSALAWRFGPLLQQDFSNWRLPSDQETLHLNAWLDQIAGQSRPQIAFLGSSPSYGISIQDAANTYPAALQRFWQAQHPRNAAVQSAQIHNLAAKGWLAGDLSVVLQRSLPHTRATIIQLNYHTFAPGFAGLGGLRERTLPDLLGVPVRAEMARLTGLRPTPPVNLNVRLQRALRQHFFVYREKDRLAALWLGSSPEKYLHQRWLGQASAAPADDEDGPAADAAPFYTLSNARQLYIVQRYSQNLDFDLDTRHPEFVFVQQMLQQLQAARQPAVFVMAPINVEALTYFEVFDAERYARNTALLRQTIAAAGYELLDLNLSAPLPEDDFVDISHTLDSGGQAFGQWLAAQTDALLSQAVAAP